MSTPDPLHDCPIHLSGTPAHADAAWQVVLPPTGAANDSIQREESDADAYRNPLWYIAFAGACLFAAMAALLAVG